MNRFKSELRKHGVMLENDYPYLPYEVSSGMYLDSIIVNAENISVIYYYNTISIINYYDKSFNIIKQDCD